MPEGSINKRIVVGQLAGVFGVKGWVKVRSYTQPEENILQYQPWFVSTHHGLKEMLIDDVQKRPQGMVVHFVGVDDRDVAALLGKASIQVDKALLPELSEGDYYWHQLQGLRVISDWNGSHLLGVVSEILETGANDVLIVQPCEGSVDSQERLVPYVIDHYVTKVDLVERVIHVKWDPEF